MSKFFIDLPLPIFRFCKSYKVRNKLLENINIFVYKYLFFVELYQFVIRVGVTYKPSIPRLLFIYHPYNQDTIKVEIKRIKEKVDVL